MKSSLQAVSLIEPVSNGYHELVRFVHRAGIERIRAFGLVTPTGEYTVRRTTPPYSLA